MTTAGSRRYSADDVRRAIPGREAELLQRLGGLTEEQTAGRPELPCPKCGGDTRFRHLLPQAPGVVRCNKCKPKGIGDVFGSIEWLRDWDFSRTVNEIGEYLHVTPGTKPKPSKNGHAHKPRGPVDAEYDYVDADGRLVFQVVRYREPKSFLQRHKLDSGQWIWNLDGVQRVLYRADVLAAQKPGATVYVVEGEKDVANLEDHGLVATTCAGGAKNWSAKHSYAKALEGLNVVIVGDNDEDGRRFVRDVADDAASTAKSIKKITLPGLPEKGDVSDFLVEHSIEEFLEIVDATPCCDWASFNSPKDAPGQGEEEAEPVEPAPRFQILTSAELALGDHRLAYWIDGVLAKNQPCLLAGVYKVLKTSIAVDVAISLATKKHFLGYYHVLDQARVLFMSAESGLATLQETAVRICRKADLSLEAIDGLFWSTDLPRPKQPDDLAAFDKVLVENQIDVVILDPAYLMLPGDDVANLFKQGEVLAQLSQLCVQREVTQILVHHGKKTTANLYEPMELHDASMAGFAEYARQWLLLSRREKYRPGTGEHKLWLSVGGSAGHSSLLGLDINEGIGHGARQWNVTTLDASECREGEQSRKLAAKDQDAEAKDLALLKKLCNRLASLPDGETVRKLSTLVGARDAAVWRAVSLGLDRSDLEACEIIKPNRKKPYEGYRLPTSVAL